MVQSVFLQADRVALCPVEAGDAEFLAAILNDPDVRDGIGATTPTALHEEREWIDEHDGVHFVVVAREGPAAGDTLEESRIGVVGYEPREPPWGVAELGYFLAPSAWGNGYATAAASLAAGHAFTERRHAKVVASVYETNPASGRVLEKVGFTHEATLRREAFIEGERVDVDRYGLFAEEYEPVE